VKKLNCHRCCLGQGGGDGISRSSLSCSSREKNNSPQPDCSGDDDRISEECILLENEIKEAMAMLENEFFFQTK
jgi:hypothetical protein